MNRFAVISDVHSNLEALTAVLSEISKKNIRKIFFLGDAVGYGSDPEECVKLLKKSCENPCLGNHDQAIFDTSCLDYFNEYARNAILWTVKNISDDCIEYLKSMKIIYKLKRENICTVHSSPREPDKWSYLLTLKDIEQGFQYFDEKICFVGHSHMPFIAERSPAGSIELRRENPAMCSASRYIVNAGSVGQPRDGDPRACYIAVANDSIEIVRVKYDIEKTQQKMLKAELPSFLIERLSKGI
ncbi:phosphodiesterase [bacterium BMS3Abin07]|nr:phosphodiesterase [bacterium BMS3Abin07]GBE31202.1 phosphodiesterase [bacterium BMS3Bbin05]HDO23014.1 metallophosphoesterase [Nitrospirota bacterium]HDZ87188.1 metallophosphoesterase [Nitrospirota bacterium]